MYIYIYVYIYIYIHVYTYVCMYVCVYVYVCMYVCMYVYIYIYIYEWGGPTTQVHKSARQVAGWRTPGYIRGHVCIIDMCTVAV